LRSVPLDAALDRFLVYNPCDHTELPKVITRNTRTLTPEEYDRLLTALPQQHRLMVETLNEAGLRWGELIALKPRHIDFLRRTLAVDETIIDVSKKHSPPASATWPSPTPRTTNPAPSASGRPGSTPSPNTSRPPASSTPISPNTLRTRIWLPADKASEIAFPVRVHDLRHAHASWLLAGGADLKSVMDRMGHAQIQTTQKYLHTLPDTDQRKSR
jgi:integrase